MNLIGDAFFAHTAFSEDQDVDAASGHLFYQAVQIFHGRTLVIFFGVRIGWCFARLDRRHIFEFPEHQLDFFGQGFPVKWLFNIIDSPGFDGLYRIGNVSVSGQKNDRKPRLDPDDFGQERHPVHFGHFDI